MYVLDLSFPRDSYFYFATALATGTYSNTTTQLQDLSSSLVYKPRVRVWVRVRVRAIYSETREGGLYSVVAQKIPIIIINV